MNRTLWSAVLGAAGLAIAGYLVLTHYAAAQVPLACGSGGIVDCEQVTSSAESMFGPLPVAVLGLAWFAIFLLLLIGRSAQPTSLWLRAQVAWSIAGLLFVFYLVYAELFLIGAICSWCTAVHAIVIVLFLLTLYDATAPSGDLSE